ncbi:MAG TPA: hypothetical protein VFN87_04355 [Solirubrobacteraceae bacterium]|nr:hypothetical protein [Solirubrobacteraceae bacterium]
MSDPTLHPDIRELDHRTSDGIDVTLLWNPVTDQVLVSVYDRRTGEMFELPVAGADALSAFQHPYAYTRRRGSGSVLAA